MANRKSYTGKDVSQALQNKGFEESNSHHKFLYLYIDGKRTMIKTRVSHGRKDYTDMLWGQLKKQLHLDNKQLDTLLACHMDHDEYVQVLKDGNVLASSSS